VPIPEASREQLKAAMARFDGELRATSDWRGWEIWQPSHKYAIQQDGLLYPVKQIISMATGAVKSQFSGGEEANSFATRHGLTIVPLKTSNQVTSDRIGQAIEVLARLKDAAPTTLETVRAVRVEAVTAVATNREITRETVLSKLSTQLGVTTSAFDDLVLRWLRDSDDTLQQQLEARVSAWSREADLRAIADFFGKRVDADPSRQPSFWWVNQGSTYQHEKGGAYLWAPKTNKAGHTFGHWTNVAKLKVGDVVFHYANSYIRAVSEVAEQPAQRPRPVGGPDGDGEEEGQFGQLTHYDELVPPIAANDIPLEWRQQESGGPFTTDGGVKQGYLFPLTAEFVSRLLGHFPHRWQDYVSLPEAPKTRVWMFQANPDVYPLSEELRKMQVGQADDWRVSRYKQEIHPGDTVILWQGGQKAPGIYATGVVTSEVYPRSEIQPWMLKLDKDPKPDWGVDFRYTRILDEPIPRKFLQSHPVLKGTMILRAPYGTNFGVSEEEWVALRALLGPEQVPAVDVVVEVSEHESYVEPPFEQILQVIREQGMVIDPVTLRRYHLSLKTRGFVILAGISGGGKTWLAEAYAAAVGAVPLLVPVAPNWNTNEDLLGFFNPLDNTYRDTRFSMFLRQAAQDADRAAVALHAARPYHLILDEMNLARVEYYFAKFLSAMETRSRHGDATIELGPDEQVPLPPNLKFVGTVNIDETTHGFADKVYDRAQLIEIPVAREDLERHLGTVEYGTAVLGVWDDVHPVAPFAFRVINEMVRYIDEATAIGVPWQTALDEQLLQKVLPKLRGAEDSVRTALDALGVRSKEAFPLTHAKVRLMSDGARDRGFASYF
jgi:hypothetical protein